MMTFNGRAFASTGKARFYREIYAKNTSTGSAANEAVISGCVPADSLLSLEFAAMAKISPFYFKNQQQRRHPHAHACRF